jgi:hypothetical protein
MTEIAPYFGEFFFLLIAFMFMISLPYIIPLILKNNFNKKNKINSFNNLNIKKMSQEEKDQIREELISNLATVAVFISQAKKVGNDEEIVLQNPLDFAKELIDEIRAKQEEFVIEQTFIDSIFGILATGANQTVSTADNKFVEVAEKLYSVFVGGESFKEWFLLISERMKERRARRRERRSERKENRVKDTMLQRVQSRNKINNKK